MSVSGVCSVCSTGEVADGCDRCGAMVCREHYDIESGLCTECLNELGGDPTTGEEYPDGVGEYRF